MAKEVVRSITVNQIGYLTNHKKIALFKGRGGTFRVVNDLTKEVVFQGEAATSIKDEASGVNVYSGDFTHIGMPGQYHIEQEGREPSGSFIISDTSYHQLHKGLLKAFYYFRCGVELEESFAGPWKHKACHVSKGKVYAQPNCLLDSSGGWHDAGDYGKYTGPGAKAVADLLLAYELYPDAFSEPVPLPESDRVMPDVLHECRVELEWLFKMQDASTGGAFHKLTTPHFPALDVMPEEDVAELYFSPISSAATGCFAGVMAMAARIYMPFNKGFAESCLQASLTAWKWLEQNPDVIGFKNPSEISTGEYGDEQDLDERYWAAAELFRTTGDESYQRVFITLSQQPFSKTNLGWADMGGYGTIAYFLHGEQQGVESVYNALKGEWLQEADRLVEQCSQDGYSISLRTEDYIWGSNMLVMNNAMLLLIAYHVQKDAKYESCALDHLHYLMGRNVLDISYVTGFGDRSVMNPHHRPSVGDHVILPVPGMVVGGPDRGLHDDYVREHLQGLPAAQCFADHEDSYSTNEVTIYWNSPAVFVVSHFNG
ncbi:glycoside hydrolase family 9 protein [Paenibacillus crassostreae]|uniref:Endoglucanase n=1 Tax=Paenibacillus crassostreae TaxID=1763538 RepID=A0A167B7D7_9BACL|nr:glycoside hydrolase family 9 protein [Paenibacillus crassostreae]AOZ93110.1 glycoside hydrolase [Paenibacillus crassostreae]OAB71801.1 glycoside hydrolase [Paenibacillus crassostreae]